MVSPDGRSSIVGFYLNSIDKKGEGGEWGPVSFMRPSGILAFCSPQGDTLV